MNIVNKNKFGSTRSKSIRKSKNKIVEILTKSKVWSLFKSKYLIKIQYTSTIRKHNFLIPNNKVVFIKLKKLFLLKY